MLQMQAKLYFGPIFWREMSECLNKTIIRNLISSLDLAPGYDIEYIQIDSQVSICDESLPKFSLGI